MCSQCIRGGIILGQGYQKRMEAMVTVGDVEGLRLALGICGGSVPSLQNIGKEWANWPDHNMRFGLFS